MSDSEKELKAKPRNTRPSAPKPASAAPAAAEDSEEKSGLGKVMVRNEYYRDGYRMALRVAVMQSFVIVLLVGVMYFIVHVNQPEDRYFATTVDGRLIPMVGLDQPNLSSPALLSWAAQAATETMTFGFSDYRRRLQESSRHFTKQGWAAFSKELADIKLIETVESQYLLTTAIPAAAPQIIEERIVGGRYQWIVQLPLIITYQSKDSKRDDRWMVTLVIVRVPRLESPNGVGIAQWVAAPG
jgi:intracellular multiplication protein IcmL